MVSTYAKADLPASYVRDTLNYDPRTGNLTWRHSRGRRIAGASAGWLEKNGQRRISLEGSTYVAQRLIWVIVKGEWPSHDIDHRDFDKSNNRWDNLRPATTTQNNRHRRKPNNNTSGYKGVSFHRQSGKWWARITANHKSISLGLFTTPEAAYAAYCDAANAFHGEFAQHQ